MQKKYFVLLLAAILILSCKSKKEKKTPDCFSPEMQINYDFVKKETDKFKAGFNNSVCDIKTIKMHFNTNHFKGIMAIALNEIVVKNCIKELNANDKELVFKLFKEEMQSVTDIINGKLYDEYSNLVDKIENNISDNEVKSFKKCLDYCGLQLIAGEGMLYITETNYYLYKLFKGKVSYQLDQYLNMRSLELRQGFADDAALMISYEELYERIINNEDFLTKYPDFFLEKEIEENQKLYLSTFLTGMDNTPVFDYDNQVLLPEIKSLYESIIARNEDRKSTGIITNYFNLLRENEFKQTENINKFMKDNNLYYDDE